MNPGTTTTGEQQQQNSNSPPKSGGGGVQASPVASSSDLRSYLFKRKTSTTTSPEKSSTTTSDTHNIMAKTAQAGTIIGKRTTSTSTISSSATSSTLLEPPPSATEAVRVGQRTQSGEVLPDPDASSILDSASSFRIKDYTMNKNYYAMESPVASEAATSETQESISRPPSTTVLQPEQQQNQQNVKPPDCKNPPSQDSLDLEERKLGRAPGKPSMGEDVLQRLLSVKNIEDLDDEALDAFLADPPKSESLLCPGPTAVDLLTENPRSGREQMMLRNDNEKDSHTECTSIQEQDPSSRRARPEQVVALARADRSPFLSSSSRGAANTYPAAPMSAKQIEQLPTVDLIACHDSASIQSQRIDQSGSRLSVSIDSECTSGGGVTLDLVFGDENRRNTALARLREEQQQLRKRIYEETVDYTKRLRPPPTPYPSTSRLSPKKARSIAPTGSGSALLENKEIEPN
ncbi:unnamed protein product [Amoebophrya sp. A25]|nr:unnamed protein product [Amoebophrya sp. A25]|eukprot:GSA25T00019883001.1